MTISEDAELLSVAPHAANEPHSPKLANLSNPWHAGVSSAVAFTLGAFIPLVAILLPRPERASPWRSSPS